MRALVDLVATHDGEHIKQEYQDLGDLYHSVGAGRYAMHVGFLAGAAIGVYQALGDDDSARGLVYGTIAVAVITRQAQLDDLSP